MTFYQAYNFDAGDTHPNFWGELRTSQRDAVQDLARKAYDVSQLTYDSFGVAYCARQNCGIAVTKV